MVPHMWKPRPPLSDRWASLSTALNRLHVGRLVFVTENLLGSLKIARVDLSVSPGLLREPGRRPVPTRSGSRRDRHAFPRSGGQAHPRIQPSQPRFQPGVDLRQREVAKHESKTLTKILLHSFEDGIGETTSQTLMYLSSDCTL